MGRCDRDRGLAGDEAVQVALELRVVVRGLHLGEMRRCAEVQPDGLRDVVAGTGAERATAPRGGQRQQAPHGLMRLDVRIEVHRDRV